jgi:hypothetical protein
MINEGCSGARMDDGGNRRNRGILERSEWVESRK